MQNTSPLAWGSTNGPKADKSSWAHKMGQRHEHVNVNLSMQAVLAIIKIVTTKKLVRN